MEDRAGELAATALSRRGATVDLGGIHCRASGCVQRPAHRLVLRVMEQYWQSSNHDADADYANQFHAVAKDHEFARAMRGQGGP